MKIPPLEVIYGLGIIVSILVSRGVTGDWIPENKFSFQASAIFPSPVLTAGTLAGLLEFLSFQKPLFAYLIPIVIGSVIGVVTGRYLNVINPRSGAR